MRIRLDHAKVLPLAREEAGQFCSHAWLVVHFPEHVAIYLCIRANLGGGGGLYWALMCGSSTHMR